MTSLQKQKVYNIIFLGLSGIIIPISILAPLGMWIPLVFSAIIFFFIEKKKLIFFKVNSLLELIPLVIIFYLACSLLWTINFSHAWKHLIHISILFFAFKIVLSASLKIKIKNKAKKALYYSFIFSCLITICDIYFNLGIKSFLLYISEIANNINNLENPSLNKFNASETKFKEGMYSGLYNRGISVITIFALILSAIFFKKKVYFYTIISFSICLILVGESFTARSILFFSLLIFIVVLILKKYFSILFMIILSFYFFLSPILLNLTTERKWSHNYEYLTNNLISLEKENVTFSNSIISLLQGESKNSLLLLKKAKYIVHGKLLHRNMIWSFTSNQIKKNILFGNGFSSSRKLGSENEISFIENANDRKAERKYFEAIPLHPHNNTLQIWLELGLLGCILFLLLYLMLWKELLKRIKSYSTENIFLILSFISVFFINQISFGLWQTWWLASIAYFLIFINFFTKKKEPRLHLSEK